jgi:ComF family protein
MQWFTSIQQKLNLPRLANALGDSLWQADCPLCKRPATQILCQDCDRQLLAMRSPSFWQTDHPLTPEMPLYSWGIYDGALKRAIAACKYNGHPEIMSALATHMTKSWQEQRKSSHIRPSSALSLVPIPLHANKLKSRGFNQAEVLAQQFSKLTKIPCHPQLLQRVKDTKAQIQTQSATERKNNLSEAFVVQASSKYLQQREVILVDDIYTSGATMREAITTLSKQNIAVRGAIVIARPHFH